MGKEKQSFNLPGPGLIQKFLIIASPCQHWARLNILSSTKLWTSFQILKFQGWSDTIVVESNYELFINFESSVPWDILRRFLHFSVGSLLTRLFAGGILTWMTFWDRYKNHIKTTRFRSLHLYHPSRQTTAHCRCAKAHWDLIQGYVPCSSRKRWHFWE